MQNGKDKPRVRLPFERRSMDLGTWVYVHRAGVCATVIALLLFGIAFVGWRMNMGESMAHQVIYLEMEPPPEEMQQPDIKEVAPVDYGNVSNRASNENAELDARLRDAAGSDAQDLYEEAAGLDDRMNANRAAYEEGLRSNREMIDASRHQPTDGSGQERSARHSGNVAASYSFTNPVRHDMHLDIPAYRCVGGGQVVVAAVLDQNGNVVSAEVERSSSTGDGCLQREALASARASQFNMDTSAPVRHRGTITYVFVPQ